MTRNKHRAENKRPNVADAASIRTSEPTLAASATSVGFRSMLSGIRLDAHASVDRKWPHANFQ